MFLLIVKIFRLFLRVQSSFWPLLVSIIVFSVTGNIVLLISLKISFYSYFISVCFLFLVIILWWKDFLRESILGYHTHKLELSLRVSVLLFILSEIFFFLSFFWAFFDSSFSPCVEIGILWPPKGISPISFYSVPLLNTVILLSRGLTVTWCHHSIINNLFNSSVFSLFITVLLGIYFIYIQYIEYDESHFSIADGVYGSTFFIATGFHGFHVFIGASFLLYTLFSLLLGNILYNHHFSFEAAAWYWHFVDVVWLFLYITIYWWGGLRC